MSLTWAACLVHHCHDNFLESSSPDWRHCPYIQNRSEASGEKGPQSTWCSPSNNSKRNDVNRGAPPLLTLPMPWTVQGPKESHPPFLQISLSPWDPDFLLPQQSAGQVSFDRETSDVSSIVSGVKQRHIWALTLFVILFSVLLFYAFGSEGIYLQTRPHREYFYLAHWNAKDQMTKES